MAEVKYMDVAEFREAGYLQEVNRRLLHPAGLALEVNTGLARGDLTALLASVGIDLDAEKFEVAWLTTRALGLHREHISGVWDDRDDPEGIFYGDVLDSAKTERVDAEIARHASVRQERFGYVVQPVPS